MQYGKSFRIYYLMVNPTRFAWVVFGSIGVLASLQVVMLVSLRRSVIYFGWETKIRCIEWATSMLRKYFSLPNSLTSNSLAKHWLRVCLSLLSSPVIILSSTYAKCIVTPLEGECFMKTYDPLGLFIPLWQSLL